MRAQIRRRRCKDHQRQYAPEGPRVFCHKPLPRMADRLRNDFPCASTRPADMRRICRGEIKFLIIVVSAVSNQVESAQAQLPSLDPVMDWTDAFLGTCPEAKTDWCPYTCSRRTNNVRGMSMSHRIVRLSILAAAVGAFAGPALGHHSFGMFDMGVAKHWSGTLTDIHLINP